jgi:hypothetical protein
MPIFCCMHAFCLIQFAKTNIWLHACLFSLSVYARKYSVAAKLSALSDIIYGLGPHKLHSISIFDATCSPHYPPYYIRAMRVYLFASRYCITVQYWVRPTDVWTFSVVHLCDASMGSSEVIGSLLASAILICGRAAFK